MTNSTLTNLMILTATCWLLFPALAAVIAFVKISISLLVWTVGICAALMVLFETPREWVLDRFI